MERGRSAAAGAGPRTLDLAAPRGRFPGTAAMRVASLAAMLPGASCGPAASAQKAQPEAVAPTQEISPSPNAAPTSCAATRERFADLDWVPTEARVAASLDLEHPDLEVALRALKAHAQTPGHGLPIDVAFALGQWAWQVPWVVETLAGAGLEPAELVYVRPREGAPAWVITVTCDFEVLRAQVEAAWDVRVRRTVDAALGEPGEGSSFPFDVVFGPGERLALTRRGAGSALLRVWSGARPDLGGAPSLGASLAGADPAPVRIVAATGGLLDPGSTPAGPDRQVLSFGAEGSDLASP